MRVYATTEGAIRAAEVVGAKSEEWEKTADAGFLALYRRVQEVEEHSFALITAAQATWVDGTQADIEIDGANVYRAGAA